MKQFFAGLPWVLSLVLAPVFARAEAPLLVTFPEKPPYYYVENQESTGLLIFRAKRIFAEAKLRVTFAQRPAQRALHEIENSRQVQCSLGWFRTKEREKFAQFSLPLYRDAPVEVLVQPSGLPEISSFKTLREVLEKGQGKLGVVAGFSYGDALDTLLKEHESHVLRVPVTVKQLMRMVGHGHLGMALIDALDYAYRSNDPELTSLSLASVSFPDVPVGNERHLMCSAGLDRATMDQINAAIVKLGYRP